MTKKILFWLDPSLVDFCIAKALQDKKNYEKYAIIETNKARSFYENQDLVSFKKLWYFRDCFSNLHSEPNLEYLEKFEKKYKINLWKHVYSDIVFNQYNNYYKFSEKEILRVLEAECKFFENIFEEINPDFLIIKVTDMSYMEILKNICYSKKITVLTLGFTRLGIRANISQEFDKLDNQTIQNKQIKNIEQFDEIKKYVSQYAKKQSDFVTNFRSSKIKWAIAGLKYLGLVSNKKHRHYYVYYGHSLFRTIFNEISFILKRRYRSSFIDRNLMKKIKLDMPFVYFPLQLEPERTILVPAPFYSDQIEVITHIAKSLPVGYKLVVKEHPMQEIRGWRPISHYNEIKNMPNVEYYHPSVPSKTLIEKCSLVATITGTSGLEAAINGKPSVVFADTIYSELPSVFRIRNIEELPDVIKTVLETKVSIKDVTDYISKIEANSFDYDRTEISLHMCRKFYYDGFLFDVEISESDMKEFIRDNYKTIGNIASEFIEKIEMR